MKNVTEEGTSFLYGLTVIVPFFIIENTKYYDLMIRDMLLDILLTKFFIYLGVSCMSTQHRRQKGFISIFSILVLQSLSNNTPAVFVSIFLSIASPNTTQQGCI